MLLAALQLLIIILSISILPTDTFEAFMKSLTLLCAVSDCAFRSLCVSTKRVSLILNPRSFSLWVCDKTKLKIKTFHMEECLSFLFSHCSWIIKTFFPQSNRENSSKLSAGVKGWYTYDVHFEVLVVVVGVWGWGGGGGGGVVKAKMRWYPT